MSGLCLWISALLSTQSFHLCYRTSLSSWACLTLPAGGSQTSCLIRRQHVWLGKHFSESRTISTGSPLRSFPSALLSVFQQLYLQSPGCQAREVRGRHHHHWSNLKRWERVRLQMGFKSITWRPWFTQNVLQTLHAVKTVASLKPHSCQTCSAYCQPSTEHNTAVYKAVHYIPKQKAVLVSTCSFVGTITLSLEP